MHKFNRWKNETGKWKTWKTRKARIYSICVEYIIQDGFTETENSGLVDFFLHPSYVLNMYRICTVKVR